MKQSVVRELSTPELIEKLEEEKENYSRMKMNHTISPVENPIQLRYARKAVARLATELRKRQLEEESK